MNVRWHRMFQKLSVRITMRTILASLLAFWITGAGCMLGCTNSTRLPEPQKLQKHSRATIASAESCSSSEAHSCCTKYRNRQLVSDPTTIVNHGIVLSDASGTVTTCPLAVRALAVSAKTRIESPSTASLIHSLPPADHSLRLVAAAPPRIEFPNRGHTYLRCCVFLI